jgi:hypothetical protein
MRVVRVDGGVVLNSSRTLDSGFWLMSDDSNSGFHFPDRDSFEHPQTVMKDLDALAVCVSS